MRGLTKETTERLREIKKKYNLATLDNTITFVFDNFYRLPEALSFNDVTLNTGYSNFLPDDVDITTYIAKDLKQNTPFMSAGMDTITEAEMSIELSQLGGSGVIHRNLSIDNQVKEVEKVKHAWNLVIENPITINHNDSLRDVVLAMKEYGISGLPVLDNREVVGIITTKDIKSFPDMTLDTQVNKIMTKKENLIYIEENSNFTQKRYFEEAKPILKEKKKDKLLVIKKEDSHYILRGLITAQDIRKREIYKNASLIDGKTLLVGAAIGCKRKGDDNDFNRVEALLNAKADYIVIDSSHGGSENVIYMTRELKSKYGDQIHLISGNICNADHALLLIEAGADALKVGVSPGATCTTRDMSGVGLPQITATREVSLVATQYNVPVITDGGFETPGHITRAIAAGAKAIMTGFLFRATKETPGEIFQENGEDFKSYRGMGSIEAMKEGSADRYNISHIDDILLLNWIFKQEGLSNQPIPQGVNVKLPYRGEVSKYFKEMEGGLRIGMGLTGKKTIEGLRGSYHMFYKETPAGRREGTSRI